MRGEPTSFGSDLVEHIVEEQNVSYALARELLTRESDGPTAIGRTTGSGYLADEASASNILKESGVVVENLPADRLSRSELCLAAARGWIAVEDMPLPLDSTAQSDDPNLAVTCDCGYPNCNCRTCQY